MERQFPKVILTDRDRALLGRDLHGFLSVSTRGGPSGARPVWFELANDDTVQMFTGRDSFKVGRVRADPRAALVVAAPVGEPENWIAVSGGVTIDPAGAGDLCARLAARYWNLADPDRVAELDSFLSSDQPT